MSTLLLATFGTTVVTILLVGVSLLLIGLVLIQKNRGAGLSGAFGGVGGNTAFGTKTGDVLTVITVCFTALFLVLSVIGVFVFVPSKITPPAAATLLPDAGGAAGGTEATPIDVTGGTEPVSIDVGATGGESTTPPATPSTPPPAPSESTTPGGQ